MGSEINNLAFYAYQLQVRFKKGLESLNSISNPKSIPYLGTFDCQGRLAPEIQPIVQSSRKVPNEEWRGIMAETD